MDNATNILPLDNSSADSIQENNNDIETNRTDIETNTSIDDMDFFDPVEHFIFNLGVRIEGLGTERLYGQNPPDGVQFAREYNNYYERRTRVVNFEPDSENAINNQAETGTNTSLDDAVFDNPLDRQLIRAGQYIQNNARRYTNIIRNRIQETHNDLRRVREFLMDSRTLLFATMAIATIITIRVINNHSNIGGNNQIGQTWRGFIDQQNNNPVNRDGNARYN